MMMRVLFLADKEHGQAVAVWRCATEMSRYGVQLLDRADGAGFDLVLAHTAMVGWDNNLETLGCPVVVLERIDGPQLTPGVRRLIANPKLKAVIKNTIYGDIEFYNQPWWRGHEITCRLCVPSELQPVPAPPRQEPELTPELYEKLRPGFSFAAYPHMDEIRNVDAYSLSGERPYTCNFVGTDDYNELKWLTFHRRSAISQIHRLRETVPGTKNFYEAGRPMNHPEYFKMLRQTEFVVSPFGLGEPCYRDYEAMLCGCMVIKPDCRHIITTPHDFYRVPPVARFICKPDFSDLADIVQTAQRVEMADRIQWANWLAKQNSSPAIARRLVHIFREALS
jgi:hypothetical protein